MQQAELTSRNLKHRIDAARKLYTEHLSKSNPFPANLQVELTNIRSFIANGTVQTKANFESILEDLDSYLQIIKERNEKV